MQQLHVHMACAAFEVSIITCSLMQPDSEFSHLTPLSRIHYFLKLKLKSLAVKLLNEVSVGLSFLFGDEFGCNKCVNLSGGDHCISLSPTVNKIFV